jgi:hypothetical protein
MLEVGNVSECKHWIVRFKYTVMLVNGSTRIIWEAYEI